MRAAVWMFVLGFVIAASAWPLMYILGGNGR